MSSNTIKGNKLLISFNGINISCQVSCNLDFDAEMIPATQPEEGRWKGFVPGLRGWTISVNAKLLKQAAGADIKNVFNAFNNGQRVFIEMTAHSDALVQLKFSGYAWVQTGNIQGGATGAANWNVTFQGDGTLATNAEDFGLIIDAMPIEAAWPIIYDTTL